MKILHSAFCKDINGHIGVIHSYKNGLLRVTFDYGTIEGPISAFKYN